MRRAAATRAAALSLAVLAGGLLAIASPAAAEDKAAKPASGGDTTDVKIDEAAGNVTAALQGQEGVRIQTMCTHCNSANIQVGGLVADLVPIAYGGYPLLGGLATSFVMSMLPADSIAEAQVARGPGEPHAPGTAAGGTISLTAATPKELPIVDGGLEGGSFKRRAAVVRAAGALTPWFSAVVTGGGEKANAADEHHDGANSIPAIRRGFADARLYFTPAKGHRIEAGASWVDESDTEGRGAVDSLKVIQSLLAGPLKSYWTREDAEFTRYEYRAGYEWRRTGGKVLTARVLSADRSQDVISQDQINQPLGKRYGIDERNFWGQARYGQPIGLKWRIAGGLEENTQRVSADGFTPPPASTLNQQATEETKVSSVFAEAGWNPSARWDALAGVRYERAESEGVTTTYGPAGTQVDNENRTDSQWEPRLTVKFRPAEGFTLKLIGGKTFRVPKPIFTEVCCGRRYLTNVEAGVGPERATTIGLEALYQPSPDVKISAYAAETDFRDHIIQLVTYSQVYRQIYANTNIDRAKARTAEVSARWTASRFVRLDGSIGWLSFFNDGDLAVPVKYRAFNNQLTSSTIPIDRIPYRPVGSGSIGAAFTLPRAVVITAQANYTGAQEIQQFKEFQSISDVTVNNILLDEPRHVAGFWMANFGVTAPVGKHLELSAGIDNAFNYVQEDLGQVTRDYNWGPLAGRTYRLGLKARWNR